MLNSFLLSETIQKAHVVYFNYKSKINKGSFFFFFQFTFTQLIHYSPFSVMDLKLRFARYGGIFTTDKNKIVV